MLVFLLSLGLLATAFFFRVLEVHTMSITCARARRTALPMGAGSHVLRLRGAEAG
jgi:hypothetical protein